LRDKVQVKVLRKRLKLSEQEFASVVRKSGTSVSAIIKEASTPKRGKLPAAAVESV
jgi:DNA-binding transcriptional regulator YiaG